MSMGNTGVSARLFHAVSAVVVNMTPLRSAAWWTQSHGAGLSLAALKGLKPVLPEQFGQYLPG